MADAAPGTAPKRSVVERELDSLVHEAERRTERVIAAVRAAVGIALGLSLSAIVSGRPEADVLLSRQVLIATGIVLAYFMLGAAAYILSSPRLYRRWFSFAFVTADAIFLYLGVYLATENIGVTANYAAALPGIWILPILIAIGAMRYSPLLQTYAMAVLVGGFAFVFLPGSSWNDLVGVPPPAALNPFFAQQPNGVRHTMLIVAGAVLVIAAWRTRRLLRAALEESRRRQSLTRFLPTEVAALVEREAADALRRGRRQKVVVAFVDIRGFTGRTERMAPEEVSRFLARFRAELRQAAEGHGGVVDKFIGDGAIVLFGVPDPRETDAVRAVAFGREVLARMEGWSAELARAGEAPVRVGIGVHGGDVFVGAVGDDARLEFTVLGDVVNVAARVEEMTRGLDSDLVVTLWVLEAAGERGGGWRTVMTMPVRGRAEPVDVCAYDPPVPAGQGVVRKA